MTGDNNEDGGVQPPLPWCDADPVHLPTAARRRTMRAIKGKDTKPEVALREACLKIGLSFNEYQRIPGTPDMSFPEEKVAVFVDGDYWHGRRWFTDGKAPKRNRVAWVRKFEANRARDFRTDSLLRKMGWISTRFWASDVMRNPEQIAAIVSAIVLHRRHITT